MQYAIFIHESSKWCIKVFFSIIGMKNMYMTTKTIRVYCKGEVTQLQPWLVSLVIK